ncbi:hypothetical protein ACM75N_11235 [Pseudomonas paraeruginosa]|uniref:hypothetical protein n=1 Tax=Pseudomonas aeruginosa group TaxID=136841 RepID=UPI00071BBAC8|nr:MULTISPECIES: hypothetical protein [Pseudomonas aeruginosa group]KSD80022.1 hypothetical protein AO903_00885 [Pseudomonas aeruginosa]MCT9628174.1 hypothetical protein [Pseudomonas aeruginosa]MCW8035467.1 hypothetical protein [Pseudomonas aeruginosa]
MSERYRVEQTGKGFWPYCVRAGNGTRDLYVGHKKTCDRVAAELTTAFRDGEFVGKGLYDALAAEAQALREEVAALRARVVVPDGYALMPLEPSPEMRLASHRYKRKNKVSTGPGFWRAMAEAAPRLNGLTVSASALDTLRRFATGEVGHLNSGHCPDDLEGRSARDPNCSVCRALIDTEKSK